MTVTNDIRCVGVNDRDIKLFEGQYPVSNGMAYNSYVILDEKIAVIDTVEANFTKEWLENLNSVLNGKIPDFLIVQHMEPDHSANITSFMKLYPKTTIVASQKAFEMMQNFYGDSYSERRIIVSDGNGIPLGKHKLTFYTAPMVHWPEVIVTYDSEDKVLFSADGFGKFGTTDTKEDWNCEARRYYFGIVGKYGAQVQSLLKKASGLDIRHICPLHGPVLNENIEKYVSLYDTWSSYAAETKGVVIAYASVYGNTKKAVEILAEKLTENGCPKVIINDLSRCDQAEAVEDAFRYDKLVLASVTYNAGIFPFMRTFIEHLAERNFQQRTVAFIENGSWAPMAAKIMKERLSACKNLTFADSLVSIKSSVNADNINQIEKLAKELCDEYK